MQCGFRGAPFCDSAQKLLASNIFQQSKTLNEWTKKELQF